MPKSTEPDRLDGWKAIAGFFGRDERTVKRWETTRGLPIHRIPGGGRAAVWADAQELSRWIGGEATPEARDAPDAPATARRSLLWGGLAAGVGLGVVGVGLIWSRRGSESRTHGYAGDPTSERLYRQALLAWDSRTPKGLDAAVRDLELLIKRRPDRAEAYAKLADCYLLLREFGSMPEAEAYARAESAAAHAAKIDPDDPASLRALAFVRFWWRGDLGALALFKRAVEADPGSVQSRMWYANALSASGRAQAALAQFRVARAAAPGDVALFADEALARATAGDISGARADLQANIELHPQSIPLWRAMVSVALRAGDATLYLSAALTEANLRGDVSRRQVVERARMALEHGGRAAFFASLGRSELAALKAGRGSWVTAANYFAVAGEREDAKQALAAARRAHEPALIFVPSLPALRPFAS